MRPPKALFLLAISLGFAGLAPAAPAHAQGTEAAADSVSSAQVDSSHGSSLIPIPVIFYQPETGTGFGASVVYLFTLSGDTTRTEGSRLFQSSMSAVAIYTTKQQIITSLNASLFPGGGRYRISTDLGFIRFPNLFWGIGNNTPDALEEEYTPALVIGGGEFQKEVASGWYAGGFGRVGYRELLEIEPDGLLASGMIPGGEDGTVVGLGLLVTRDTRSNNVYPRSGGFHQFRAGLYDGFFGSKYEFSTFSLDLRTYLGLSRSVFALRAFGVASGGEPSFDLMPQLGGENLLRGYFAGRFRDRSLLAFQAEYRSPRWWRLGGVVFASAGQVAVDYGGLRMDEFHASAGFGFRFLLSRADELNIRADFGWGFDVGSNGFYLGIAEAF
jgi:hypothetical protein